MYSTQFFPLVIRHLKFSRLIASAPFEYDAKSGKLIGMKGHKRVRVSQMQSLITLTYLLVLLYNFFFGGMPMLKRLQGVPFLMCYSVLTSLGWNVGLDIAPIQMINSIINFERDLLQGMY